MNIIIGVIILAASFIFAMLGLGGGMVYVPVINWAGYDMVSVAIPLGLLLNGLNTLFVLIPFARKKLVDWKGGAIMAGTALVAAPLGAMSSGSVPVSTLKLLFAAMVLAAAIRMVWSSKQAEPEKMLSLKRRSILGFFTGAFAGFVGGMLGLGGGFIIAPILMAMGYKTKQAAATTAFVVTFSSFSGYLGHMAEGQTNWALTAIVVAAVVIGSQLGGMYMTRKAKSKQVKIIYAVVLFIIAFKMSFGAFKAMSAGDKKSGMINNNRKAYPSIPVLNNTSNPQTVFLIDDCRWIDYYRSVPAVMVSDAT